MSLKMSSVLGSPDSPETAKLTYLCEIQITQYCRQRAISNPPTSLTQSSLPAHPWRHIHTLAQTRPADSLAAASITSPLHKRTIRRKPTLLIQSGQRYQHNCCES